MNIKSWIFFHFPVSPRGKAANICGGAGFWRRFPRLILDVLSLIRHRAFVVDLLLSFFAGALQIVQLDSLGIVAISLFHHDHPLARIPFSRTAIRPEEAP